jgi:hypothetical protein
MSRTLKITSYTVNLSVKPEGVFSYLVRLVVYTQDPTTRLFINYVDDLDDITQGPVPESGNVRVFQHIDWFDRTYELLRAEGQVHLVLNGREDWALISTLEEPIGDEDLMR